MAQTLVFVDLLLVSFERLPWLQVKIPFYWIDICWLYLAGRPSVTNMTFCWLFIVCHRFVIISIRWLNTRIWRFQWVFKWNIVICWCACNVNRLLMMLLSKFSWISSLFRRRLPIGFFDSVFFPIFSCCCQQPPTLHSLIFTNVFYSGWHNSDGEWKLICLLHFFSNGIHHLK